MNIEVLTQRIAEVDMALQNTVNQYNALVGRKEECKLWLEQLQKPVEDEDGAAVMDELVE